MYQNDTSNNKQDICKSFSLIDHFDQFDRTFSIERFTRNVVSQVSRGLQSVSECGGSGGSHCAFPFLCKLLSNAIGLQCIPGDAVCCSELHISAFETNCFQLKLNYNASQKYICKCRIPKLHITTNIAPQWNCLHCTNTQVHKYTSLDILTYTH